MAHARAHSVNDAKNPHSISLKVLRLSRPSLSRQHPLPLGPAKPDSADENALNISPLATLTVPSFYENADPDATTEFTLTPALTLPSSFASAYVGETFASTLSANNELPEGSDRSISNVKITAEMQTPSNPSGSSLDVSEGEASEASSPGEEEEAAAAAAGKSTGNDAHTLGPGSSLQRIVRLELKEEGSHILAVTVTYTESQVVAGAVSRGEDGRRSPAVVGARVRTFRKLYQFVAQQLLSVRTKTGEVPTPTSADQVAKKYVLEAQLENMSEGTVCLESVTINAKEPFRSTSLNWDLPVPLLGGGMSASRKAPLLSPRDVVQVAFLLERKEEDAHKETVHSDGRKVLGQLSIHWRGHMGDQGSLSTGWLTAKAR